MPIVKISPQSVGCYKNFSKEFNKVTKQKYSKNDREIYQKLIKYGDEKKAIELAKKNYTKHSQNINNKLSAMCPACTVYLLVEEIKSKV